eukprot:CAMPEP_0115149514 /NCGR_PEP_ID=MMETSP0227-20121206/64490_1 /TAXON_ID=89957 /ORGANISM="Polarella glacialis, Strain CCMP 1383" /LENGTH=41 /DNA_ID= /DNA_START= /DNA_END= /DNA_ORIENTATION=
MTRSFGAELALRLAEQALPVASGSRPPQRGAAASRASRTLR